MPAAPLNLDAIDLSNEKLTRLAGSGAFARGVDYFRQDPQLVYRVNGDKVTASISGTHTYHQQLTFARQGLDGYCSCPASDNVDFCKHCVALALAVRESQTVDPLTSAKKPRISARQKELDLIKRYLEGLDRSELEASMLSLIDSDKTYFTQWALRAHHALNPADSQFLKKKITQAFPINKSLRRHSQVAQYFAQAEPIIDMLLAQRESLGNDDLLMLADYALTRLDKALQSIDDSGGYRSHCQDSLQALMIDAVSAQPFSQAQLITFLLEKLQQNNPLAPDIPASYQHLLGDDGRDAFYRALLELWRTLEVPASVDSWDETSDYHLYFYQLKRFAQQTDQRDLLVELQQRNARTASDFADLVDLLISTEQWPQAADMLTRAQQCRDAHHVSNQLLNAEMKLLVQQELYTDAYLLLEHAFSTKPCFSLYEKLHKFSELYGTTFEFYDNSHELIDNHELEDSFERIDNHEPVESPEYTSPTSDDLFELDSLELGLEETPLNNKSQAIHFDPQAIIEQLTKRQAQDPLLQFTLNRLILDILFYHQRYSDILALDAQDKLPKEYLEKLISAYPNSPKITLPLYEKLVASLVAFSDNEHYRQAIAALICAQREAVEPACQWEFNALLTRLKTHYKTKRNFIKYLNAAFAV